MAEEGGNNVFVYMGGGQRVPRDITHVRVHKSVKIITARAFCGCMFLVSVEMHDGVEIIENYAFYNCSSLRRINLLGVRAIGKCAFSNCRALEGLEFGDKLETIGSNSFACTSLRSIKLPKVRGIGYAAFQHCDILTDVKLSEDLETIEGDVFMSCPRLRHIAMPLKANLLGNNVFYGCGNLSTVDLVGGIHKTVSSLLLESWRNEMNDVINEVNQDLPNRAGYNKTRTIRQWIERVLERIEHYKSEHYALLKKNMTQLELALWDANLLNVDAAARHEARVTCGANIIIPHVLSFLNDADVFHLLDYDQQH